MFCSKCGVSMPDESASCPRCGAAVQSVPQPSAPQPAAPAASPYYNAGPAQQQVPGQYPGPYAQRVQESEGNATASMVLGILSLVCFGILAGIPAIILGHMAKSKIRQSGGRLGGDGKATAGLIMGYISLAFTLLIVPALVIPSLIRARSDANTRAAVITIRTLNSSQVAYTTSYVDKGFAVSLAQLGPGAPAVDCTVASNINSDHACLIDATLGCASGTWCEKNGYRFNLTGTCAGVCSDYVITVTPRDPSSGTKSFCSMSDAVIRTRRGRVFAPVTPEECRSWSVDL